ncbi:alpha-N-acetylglucosaminidase [Brachybacterium hainanense]|uniref:Alpha-N-acetylglucosaminidase TIM-barrel domain-containing protein n=1 Tax=Brachybacterium hainanense TaxID=1541174 RepID=A0ABV6R844_9MICO
MSRDLLAGVRGLARRRAPALEDRLRLRLIGPAGDGLERVLVHTDGDVLRIEASTASAACVGLARALEDVFDADLSAQGPAVVDASAPLPRRAPQRFATALRRRYHHNPVAFGYSAASWDWERWERHIDDIALHGATAPLLLVGHEAVLVAMLRDLDVPQEEAARFVGGPAFLPWTTMGITHDLGAVLTPEALADRAQLGRRIADRARELGMQVVLPGFGGQLPASLAGTARTIEWQGWRSSLADPGSALFAEAAASLHRHQRELLGTDHLYAVDPYIESLPPAGSPQDLAAHAGAIYAAMHRADPEAEWILQGWPFHYRASFWTPERVHALLSRVPQDRLVLLDLWGEHAPMWQRTGGMYGRRWLWCLTHDFGGRFAVFGDIRALDADLAGLRTAAAEGTRGRLEGFGLTGEALEDDAVVHELAARALWSPMPPLEEWLDGFVARRYGMDDARAREVWELLGWTLYGPGRTRATPSPLIARPWSAGLPFASQRLAGEPLPDASGPPSANLDAENDAEMLGALPHLAAAARTLLRLRGTGPAAAGGADALGHDAAQLVIHVAAQSARAPLRAMAAASAAGDGERVRAEASVLEALLHGVDAVAATRPDMLVGTWIAAARRSAGPDRRLADALERDARSLVSVWGEQDSGLHDYAARHWSGLLTDLHLARWRAWATWLAAIADGTADAADPAPLRTRIQRIEEDWRGATSPYPTAPYGDLTEVTLPLLDLAETQIPRLIPPST